MVFLKNVMGLCASMLGFFICLVYRNTIVVFKASNKINDKLFDSHLITLSDYSVQGEITRAQYMKFLSNENVREEHAVMQFEQYLGHEIKEWLMRQDRNKSVAYDMYEIADIQLAFDNDCL